VQVAVIEEGAAMAGAFATPPASLATDPADDLAERFSRARLHQYLVEDDGPEPFFVLGPGMGGERDHGQGTVRRSWLEAGQGAG
jgi:hypothetical protein